jgi:hypothetical protein
VVLGFVLSTSHLLGGRNTSWAMPSSALFIFKWGEKQRWQPRAVRSYQLGVRVARSWTGRIGWHHGILLGLHENNLTEHHVKQTHSRNITVQDKNQETLGNNVWAQTKVRTLFKPQKSANMPLSWLRQVTPTSFS